MNTLRSYYLFTRILSRLPSLEAKERLLEQTMIVRAAQWVNAYSDDNNRLKLSPSFSSHSLSIASPGGGTRQEKGTVPNGVCQAFASPFNFFAGVVVIIKIKKTNSLIDGSRKLLVLFHIYKRAHCCVLAHPHTAAVDEDAKWLVKTKCYKLISGWTRDDSKIPWGEGKSLIWPVWLIP